MIITLEDLYNEYQRIMNNEVKLGRVTFIPKPTEIYRIVSADKIAFSEEIVKEYFDLIEANNCENCSVFTAVVIMSTLLTKGYWYEWRENQYNN